MKIKIAIKDKETGVICAVEVWAHRIKLTGVDLELAAHPRYSINEEGSLRRHDNDYRLTDTCTGYSIAAAASMQELIGMFLFRVEMGKLPNIKSELAVIPPVAQLETINAH